jgi:hypothetical protein
LPQSLLLLGQELYLEPFIDALRHERRGTCFGAIARKASTLGFLSSGRKPANRIRRCLNLEMAAFKSLTTGSDRKDIDFVYASLGPANRKVAVPIQLLLHNLLCQKCHYDLPTRILYNSKSTSGNQSHRPHRPSRLLKNQVCRRETEQNSGNCFRSDHQRQFVSFLSLIL